MTDITIQGWMRDLMCLKGIDLLVYATIHSLEDHEVLATTNEICSHVAIVYGEPSMRTKTILSISKLQEEGLIKMKNGGFSIVDEEIAKACV